MNCAECGSYNPDNANFCNHCGAEMESYRMSPTGKKTTAGNTKLKPFLIAAVVGMTVIMGVIFVVLSIARDVDQNSAEPTGRKQFPITSEER